MFSFASRPLRLTRNFMLSLSLMLSGCGLLAKNDKAPAASLQTSSEFEAPEIPDEVEVDAEGFLKPALVKDIAGHADIRTSSVVTDNGMMFFLASDLLY